jgi:hypothetical protein
MLDTEAVQNFAKNLTEEKVKRWLIDIDIADRLIDHVRKFISDHHIGCPESVFQLDKVSEDSLEFIGGCCEIVGYESR